MKNMKIRVNEANRQEVKAALLNMGYQLCSDRMQHDKYDICFAYYVDEECDVILHNHPCKESYFDSDWRQEHVLFNGEFQPMGYFTQPKTPEQKPVASIPKPPLGLRPRNVVLRERNREILEAIGRYVEANKQAPHEWIEELAQNNMEVGE